jgi:hypothetical protein
VIFHSARNGRLRLTWSIVIAYLAISMLHAAFDIFGGVVTYVIVSIIGMVPLVYLWRRGDRRTLLAGRTQVT